MSAPFSKLCKFTHSSSNDSSKGVPCSLIKPVQKVVESIVSQVMSSTIVKPVGEEKFRVPITCNVHCLIMHLDWILNTSIHAWNNKQVPLHTHTYHKHPIPLFSLLSAIEITVIAWKSGNRLPSIKKI